MHRLFLVVAAVAGIAGCQTAVLSPNARSEVASVAQAWSAAFNTCDVNKLTALYDPEAVLWGQLSPVIISSPAGIRQYFEKVCSLNPKPKVALGDQLIRVYGAIAINSGTWTFTVFPDGQPRLVPARFSGTYRNTGGQWLLVDHHSSAIPSSAIPGSAR